MDINSTLDALIKLDEIVDNTELSYVEVKSFLNKYNLVKKVSIPLTSIVNISAETLELEIPEEKETEFYDKSILNDSFWEKQFLKKEKLFSTNLNVTLSQSNDDYNFLTKEVAESLSAVVANNKLSFSLLSSNRTNYSKNELERTPATAIPLDTIKNIVPTIGTKELKLNGERLDAVIHLGNADSDIEINESKLNMTNFNLKSFVLANKTINNLNQEIDVSKLNRTYLKKDGEIENNALFRDGADHNAVLFKDIEDTPYIQAGRQPIVKVNEYTKLDVLNKIIEGHFKEDGDKLLFNDNRVVSRDNLDLILSKIISYYSV